MRTKAEWKIDFDSPRIVLGGRSFRLSYGSFCPPQTNLESCTAIKDSKWRADRRTLKKLGADRSLSDLDGGGVNNIQSERLLF
jgi:hypothetical protein